MTAWSTFTPEQKAVAERVFDALSSVDTLSNPIGVAKRQLST